MIHFHHTDQCILTIKHSSYQDLSPFKQMAEITENRKFSVQKVQKDTVLSFRKVRDTTLQVLCEFFSLSTIWVLNALQFHLMELLSCIAQRCRIKRLLKRLHWHSSGDVTSISNKPAHFCCLLLTMTKEYWTVFQNYRCQLLCNKAVVVLAKLRIQQHYLAWTWGLFCIPTQFLLMLHWRSCQSTCPSLPNEA